MLIVWEVRWGKQCCCYGYVILLNQTKVIFGKDNGSAENRVMLCYAIMKEKGRRKLQSQSLSKQSESERGRRGEGAVGLVR